MCGFLLVVDRRRQIDLTEFGSQLDLMRHRGQDDSGIWISDRRNVALGSRRLAIQDLSPAGHMPMSDATGLVTLVFNGEIYNFQELREDLKRANATFYGGSDTEVVLASYLFWG